MSLSQTFDPSLHEVGSAGAEGRCSHHVHRDPSRCTGEAVVSFQDQDGQWQSGCSLALEQLVKKGEIEPLGQGG